MGSPYDKQYVVKESEAPKCYKGKLYAAGEPITMKATDYWACQSTQPEETQALWKGFPEYCLDENGTPIEGYRVPFTIPADGAGIIVIPHPEGWQAANKVHLFYCSSCAFLGVDADPITDPADPIGQTGGGGIPNPQLIDLTGCESTLHLVSCDGADVKGMAMFYC